MVKASPSRVADPGLIPTGDFAGLSHTTDLKVGTTVTNLTVTQHHKVSAGTGWSSISILELGEIGSVICNFSVWQHIHSWQSRSVHEIH